MFVDVFGYVELSSPKVAEATKWLERKSEGYEVEHFHVHEYS